MRSTLRSNGKISEPTSLAWARWRQEQLQFETAKIINQLAVPRDETATYLDWRQRASRMLGRFQEEERQYSEWIKKREAVRVSKGEQLLRDARDVLKTLSDEVDFDPPELELLTRLNEHFADVDGVDRKKRSHG